MFHNQNLMLAFVYKWSTLLCKRSAATMIPLPLVSLQLLNKATTPYYFITFIHYHSSQFSLHFTLLPLIAIYCTISLFHRTTSTQNPIRLCHHDTLHIKTSRNINKFVMHFQIQLFWVGDHALWKWVPM